MLLPRGIEEAYFRPAANGWVFSAVNPCMIGRRRFYLVSDAQKEALGRCIRRGRPLRLVAILPLLWGALLLAPYLHEPTIATWALAGLLILGFCFWLNLADYIAIRGELADLRATTERFGTWEMYRTQARAMSVQALAVVVGCNGLVGLGFAINWLVSAHAPFMLIAALGSLTSAATFAPMLVMRLRSGSDVARA